MKNKASVFLSHVFLASLLGLMAVACIPYAPDDGTLLLYTRSLDVYREGRFADAAKMLAGEKNFAPALVLRGKAEYLSGDLDAADRSLKRALALNPHNAEASLFLARLRRDTGKADEARRITEKILGDNPMDIRALRFAAELAREKGASGEAASAVLLDRAAEASVETVLVFLDRARLRWIGGNSAGALEDLGRAQALLSDDSPLVKAVEKLKSVICEVSP